MKIPLLIRALASLLVPAMLNGRAAEFTVDPTQSIITLSGSALSFPIEEQSPGSLSTHFGGRISADPVETMISFPGGSALVAENSGNWQPGVGGSPGAAPANFGGQASAGLLGSVLAAVRNSQFDVTSDALPLSGGDFDSGSLLFKFAESSAGSLDYSVSGLFSRQGSIVLAGLATNRVTARASLSGALGNRILTIPLAADYYFKLISDNDVKLTITGQLIAREMPSSIVLLDNGNIFAVQSGPTSPTTFTVSVPTVITYIHNYHYFNNGALPGTIALRHEDGTIYGPWPTTGLPGQGGVPNAYWMAKPYVAIKAGQYTVVDSGPATWSHNSASGFAGFTYIQGYAVVDESLPTLSISLSPDRKVVVAWPKTATGFALYRTTSLRSAHWTVVSEPAVDEGAQRVVKLPAQATQEFYRLAK